MNTVWASHARLPTPSPKNSFPLLDTHSNPDLESTLKQNIADAFIVASCDDELQDRWIPDEDWVWPTRQCLGKECALCDMNMGLLSKRLAFLNDRAIVLHNNNKVQTGEGSQKQNVHFYYVLGVATKQDFYQAIWDAPQCSNCSLQCTLPPQAKQSSTPPTKKAKASYARPIFPASGAHELFMWLLAF
jgi:hypothetical protein